MSNVANLVAKLDASQANRGLKGLTSNLGGVKGAALAVGAAVGVAAVAGVAAFAKSSISAFAEAGDSVQKMALRTGFSTIALSELTHAAELSGTSISSMENGVKRMQRTLLDAEQGLSTAVDAMELLGVNMDDVAGKSPEEQFRIMTEALAEVEDASKRSAIAQQVFGRAGTQLLPMLAAGKQGLADMRQEAHDLGLVFSQESADSAAEYQDSLTKLKGAFQGIQFAIGKALVPVLIPLIEMFTKVAIITREVLGPALKVLGVLFKMAAVQPKLIIAAVKLMIRTYILAAETLLDLARKVPFLGDALEKLGEIARAFSENWRDVFDGMIDTVEGWANSVIRTVNDLIGIIPKDIAERLGIKPLNEIELPRLKAQTEAAEVAISGLELASEELATTAAAASALIIEETKELTERDKRLAQFNKTAADFSTSIADNELAIMENIEAQFDQGHAYNSLRDSIHKTIADEEKLTEAREAEADAAAVAADKIIAAAQKMQEEGNRQLARAGVTNAYFDSAGALQTIDHTPQTSAQRAASLMSGGINFGGTTNERIDGKLTGREVFASNLRFSPEQLKDLKDAAGNNIFVKVDAGIWEHDEAALGKAIAGAINEAAKQTGPVLSSGSTQP